jgi:MinD-like ATPase involved in chromosome partitioning or flagellar assembly
LKEQPVPKIISTHSFRGGTGKSNTTANLAAIVAQAGHRVGVIDTDIQSPGIHALFKFEQQYGRKPLNDFLWKRCRIEEAAHDVTEQCIGQLDGDALRPRLFLIPSSLDTNEIARILREGYDVALLNDGIQSLISALQLDYLFIDTHPGVNEETLLSIAISDVLVLVMRPDQQDFQGTAVTVELAKRLEVPEMFLVVNKTPPDSDERALRRKIEESYGTPVAAVLPLSVEIARLASGGLFANRFPDHPLTLQLRSVAERIQQAGKV